MGALLVGDVVVLVGIDADHPQLEIRSAEFGRSFDDAAIGPAGGDEDDVDTVVEHGGRDPVGLLGVAVPGSRMQPGGEAGKDQLGHKLDVGIGGDRALLEPCTERLDERLRVGPDVADLAGRRLECCRRADEERTLLVGEVDSDDVRRRGRPGVIDQHKRGVGVFVGEGEERVVHEERTEHQRWAPVGNAPQTVVVVGVRRFEYDGVEAELGGRRFDAARDQVVERAVGAAATQGHGDRVVKRSERFAELRDIGLDRVARRASSMAASSMGRASLR